MKTHTAIAGLLLVYAMVGQNALLARTGAEAYDQSVQVVPLLQTDKTSIGQPITYPDTDEPEVTIVKVIIPPGAATGWHKHPLHGYAVILQGELNVKRRDGESTIYRAGDAFAEMIDVMHYGENSGDESVELIMFITGKRGAPFSVPVEPEPAAGD
jgi:quercetin dioxygenase-like cupin family protein